MLYQTGCQPGWLHGMCHTACLLSPNLLEGMVLCCLLHCFLRHCVRVVAVPEQQVHGWRGYTTDCLHLRG